MCIYIALRVNFPLLVIYGIINFTESGTSLVLAQTTKASDDFATKIAIEILVQLEPEIDVIKPKWHEIGLSLGLEAELALLSSVDEGELLFQVIRKWVEKSLGANMWLPLIHALRKVTRSNITTELEENYCHEIDISDNGKSYY